MSSEVLYPAMFAVALVLLMLALWSVVQGWRVRDGEREVHHRRGVILFVGGMSIMAALKYLTDF